MNLEELKPLEAMAAGDFCWWGWWWSSAGDALAATHDGDVAAAARAPLEVSSREAILDTDMVERLAKCEFDSIGAIRPLVLVLATAFKRADGFFLRRDPATGQLMLATPSSGGFYY